MRGGAHSVPHSRRQNVHGTLDEQILDVLFAVCRLVVTIFLMAAIDAEKNMTEFEIPGARCVCEPVPFHPVSWHVCDNWRTCL